MFRDRQRGKAALIPDKITAARAEGCDIDCDAYPYAAGANPLENLLPPWVHVGGNEVMLARRALHDGSNLARVACSRPGPAARVPVLDHAAGLPPPAARGLPLSRCADALRRRCDLPAAAARALDARAGPSRTIPRSPGPCTRSPAMRSAPARRPKLVSFPQLRLIL